MVFRCINSRLLRVFLTGFLVLFFHAVNAAPPADLKLALVVDGISGAPLAVRHAGDDSGRIFIVTRAGKIYIHDGNQLLSTPFLDISDRVRSGGERGLLGLDFHPEFAVSSSIHKGEFFVNYSDRTGGDTVIARFKVPAATPNVADAGSEDILLEVDQPYSNHNGGDIHFGADGYLYIGMGDGGSGGDPEDYARHLENDKATNSEEESYGLLGKMLRIDVNGSTPGSGACGLVGNYGIPASNPFVGTSGACAEIWAYGLRNPWRWSFDRFTHDLIIGDVGQNTWEEVDFQPASSGGGEYYGWSCMEGNHTFKADRCDSTLRVDPILEYAHSEGCSVTGGYRYRGPIQDMNGIYIYGDYCSGSIWFAERQGGTWTASVWKASGLNISSFGEDEEGNVYVVDSNGAVYRFESATAGDTYSIGGSVSGLASGNSVVLQNNGGNDLSVNANGSFTFANRLPDSSTYEVTVLMQPTSPNQTCSVSNGAGTVSGADVTDVDVSCVTNTYTVGGAVSGLPSGDVVVLQNNGGDDLTVNTVGSFVFDTALDDGRTYDVAVLTQPSTLNLACAVTNGMGTLSGSNVTNIEVICATNYCSQADEILNYTVTSGEQFICIASGSIQVEDFTVMAGGDALLQAPEVVFVTDQQDQVSIKNGGTLTVIP